MGIVIDGIIRLVYRAFAEFIFGGILASGSNCLRFSFLFRFLRRVNFLRDFRALKL